MPPVNLRCCSGFAMPALLDMPAIARFHCCGAWHAMPAALQLTFFVHFLPASAVPLRAPIIHA
jgi:hypothetical protein